MKYVSIDIETTGLDKDKNQIVEIGAVIDKLGSDTPIKELPKFRAVLIHKEMQINAYCADLHRDLWPEILTADELIRDALKTQGNYYDVEKDTHYLQPKEFEIHFYQWLFGQLGIVDNRGIAKDSPRYKHLPVKINVAGKNPGNFDIPFIEALPGWQGLVKFHRRVLDPAILCTTSDDEHIPDLQECLKRCHFVDTVNHTAIGDALDIIRVIRTKF